MKTRTEILERAVELLEGGKTQAEFVWLAEKSPMELNQTQETTNANFVENEKSVGPKK